MGDVAMLAHTLRAFRAAYPDVRVTLLTQRAFRPFFRGLDIGFLDFDKQGEHRGLRGLLRLACAARRLGADAVADMHDVLRSKFVRGLLWAGGLRVRHIDKGRREKKERLGHPERNRTPLRHTVQRYGDVLRALGFRFDDPAPAAKPDVPNPFAPKRGVWIGFAPFSAQRGKSCPEPLAAETVVRLAARCDRLFIHSGDGAEADFARSMEALHPNVTALRGGVTLEGEIDLIAHIDCMVSMDSVAMHLAALVATPVVSVWGATHPALGFLGWGCRADDCVQLDLPCRPCSSYGALPCRYGDYRCLHGLTADAIAARVDEALRRTAAGTQAR